MSPDKLIAEIKDEQLQLALAAMTTPAPDFAAYRQVVGRYAGLQAALDLLLRQLRDEDE